MSCQGAEALYGCLTAIPCCCHPYRRTPAWCTQSPSPRWCSRPQSPGDVAVAPPALHGALPHAGLCSMGTLNLLVCSTSSARQALQMPPLQHHPCHCGKALKSPSWAAFHIQQQQVALLLAPHTAGASGQQGQEVPWEVSAGGLQLRGPWPAWRHPGVPCQEGGVEVQAFAGGQAQRGAAPVGVSAAPSRCQTRLFAAAEQALQGGGGMACTRYEIPKHHPCPVFTFRACSARTLTQVINTDFQVLDMASTALNHASSRHPWGNEMDWK